MSQQPQQAPENTGRGTLFALAAIPVGVVIWVLLWRAGFIASIVAFGVAFIAMYLYRLGSGGSVGRSGAVRITVVTITTLLLAFFAGVVSDARELYSEVLSGTGGSLLSSDFRAFFSEFVALDGVVGEYAKDFALALLFGALGCFGVLRSAFGDETPRTQAPDPMPTPTAERSTAGPVQDPFGTQDPPAQSPPGTRL